MALNVGELNATLNMDASDYTKGLTAAEKAAKKWGTETEKAASQVSNKYNAALGVAKTAVVGFGAALFGAGLAGIKMAGDMQKTSATFEVLLGSAEAATMMMKDLKEFADTTPFQFPEVATAAKNLVALGIESDKINDTLRNIGNIAAGVNIPFGELADIYGKINVQGRVFAEDINQLQGRGIPVVEELAKQYGVTREQIMQMVTDGKIGFKDIERAFAGLTGEGGKFAGMMEKLSKTLPGLLSTAMDRVQSLLISFGQSLIKYFNLEEIIDNFNKQTKKLIDNIEKSGLGPALINLIPPEIQIAIVAIGGALTAILIPALISSGVQAVKAAANFVIMNASLLPIIATGAAIAAGAYLIWANWEQLIDLFSDIGTVMTSSIREGWAKAKLFILDGVDAIVGAWVTMYGWIPKLGDKIKDLKETTEGLVFAQKEEVKAVKSVDLATLRANKQFKFTYDAIDKILEIFPQLTGVEKKNTDQSKKQQQQQDKTTKSFKGAAVGINAVTKSQEKAVAVTKTFGMYLKNIGDIAQSLGLGNFAKGILNVSQSVSDLEKNMATLTTAIGTKGISGIFGNLEALTAVVNIISSGWDAIKKATTATKNVTVDLTVKYATLSTNFVNLAKTTIGFGSTFTTRLASTRDALARALTLFSSLADVVNQGIGSAFTTSVKTFLSGESDFLTSLRDGIKNAIIDAITTAVIQGTILKGAIGGLLSQLTEQLAVGADVTGTISKIGAAIPAVAMQLTSLLSPLRESLTAAFPTTEIPAMANGGLVTRPTMALIGEAGPEVVTPLNQIGNMGGGQQVIELYLDSKLLTRKVVENMPSYIRMKTGVAL